MEGSASIAELSAEHAVLATELVHLDRHIQVLSRASLEGTRYDAITRSAVASITKADILWLQLDDILNRRNAIVVALIAQAASNTGELRDKGQILATLLRANRPTENDLTQALSLSLVRDIITLFPELDSAAPH
jgi:predicted DNA-binding ribbon-helix-helix protein